jgi:excisionase family DNA binding protein
MTNSNQPKILRRGSGPPAGVLDQLSPRVEYLSVVDCETISGISRWTWRQWAYVGKITSYKPGGRRLLIPRSELDRVFAESMRPARHHEKSGNPG